VSAAPSVLSGVLMGAGVAVVLDRSRRRRQVSDGAHPSPSIQGAHRRAVAYLARRLELARSQDLAVTATSATSLAAAQLTGCVLGAAAAGGVGAAAGLVGHSPGSIGAVVLVALGALVGVVLPRLGLPAAARRRRRDMVAALSALADLVTVLLAGGAGIETALVAAAGAGQGWAFEQFRSTIERARLGRRSVWDALGELGLQLGVDELVEFAAAVSLAARHGARVASSLAARAEVVRSQLLADVEAQAQSATERMGLPAVGMFAGLLFLLGYPAVQLILGSH